MQQRCPVKVAIVIGQVLITVTLFWYIAQRFDLAMTLGHIAKLAPATIVGAVAIYATQLLLVSYRLRLALRVVGGNCTLSVALQSVLIGSFFSQTPLSILGGDMARVWVLTRDAVPVRTAATAVTLDRVFGFLGLIFVILLALPALWSHATAPELRAGIVIMLALAGAAPLVLLALQKMPKMARRFRLIDWIGQVSEEFHALLRRKAMATLVLGLAVTVHFASLITLYIFACDVGAAITFWEICYLAPFPLLSSLLPISIGGWGIRETAMVVSFSLIAVPEAQSLTISILFGLLSLAMALPGGVVWLSGQLQART